MSHTGLILTRRPDETVCIGSDITVTVLGVKGKQVRLLFSAPPDVMVLRGELVDRGPEAAKQAEIDAAWSEREVVA